MRVFTVLITFVCFCIGCQQEPVVRDVTLFTNDLPRESSSENQVVPDLSSIDQGIDVNFSENPVSEPPVVTQRDGYSRFWSYEVSVESATRVTIDQWGVIERRESGSRHRSFSRGDFAELFNCPDAQLEPGQSYTYKSASELGPMPGNVRWYFVGVDSHERATQGQAVVTSELSR